MRARTDGGYGPAHSIPVSWLDSSTSTSAFAHSARTLSLTCPRSVHTTAFAPVAVDMTRTPIGLAASCGMAYVVTVVRDNTTLPPIGTRVQFASSSSGQLATVPSLANSDQPHFLAPAAAPRT